MVDCTTLTESLAEAELFGARRGSYSGAIADHTGLVAAADGGTLFLDELGELALAVQAKLLRLLNDGTYRRVGETAERHAEVRVVAATNRDVDALVVAGRFKSDLFHRLNGHRITIRPLRERIDDLELLAEEFAIAVGFTGIDAAALRVLLAYAWPGNVRELNRVIRVTASRAPLGTLLDEATLARGLRVTPSPTDHDPLAEAREHVSREVIARALAQADGHVGLAAGALGMTRQGLSKAIKRYGLR